MEKGKAAYCPDCNQVFSYQSRDIFSGEVFCPKCSGRASKKFKTLRDAKKATKQS